MTTCPRCGDVVVSGQEYCLSCGGRLPGPDALGRTRGGDGTRWTIRAGVALVVALAGAALAVAATGGESGGGEVVTATGGFATLPTTSTLPAPAETGPGGTIEWPSGEEGWTIALASVPQTAGRRVAVARAREARRRGLAAVGILDTSRYASLHPGYFLVFAGVHGSEAEATSALEPARRVSRTASVRRIVP